MVEGAVRSIAIANERSWDEDWEIVQKIQLGNFAAFNSLMRKYRERIYCVLLNLLGNHADTADLTQESFIQAFRSIQSFKGNSAFYTWLYRIAVNKALARLRQRKIRKFFSLDSTPEETEEYSALIEKMASTELTDHNVLTTELSLKINEALQGLSAKHRTVVVLFEIEGLSHAEIAKILKCSEGTVRSRLHYAKEFLKKQLRPYLTD